MLPLLKSPGGYIKRATDLSQDGEIGNCAICLCSGLNIKFRGNYINVYIPRKHAMVGLSQKYIAFKARY